MLFRSLRGGRPAEAAAILRQVAREDASVEPLFLLGEALEALGDAGGALAAYAEAIRLASASGEVWFSSYAHWIAGLAHWLDGDPENAQRMQTASLQLTRLTSDRLGVGTSLEALATLCADHDPVQAARLLGSAQAQWERIDTSPSVLAGLRRAREAIVGQLQFHLGDLYEVEFEHGRALDLDAAIELALTAATGTEAPRPQTMPATTADGTVGVRRPASTKGRRPGDLTARQVEIARLVAAGLSNREIAEHLVISQRTAETHVENILSRLGFTNRAQITAWLSERDRA